MITAKILHQIAHRTHVHNVFNDFLQMCVSAFCFGKDEENYNECAKRYDKEQIKLFGDALGALMLDYTDKVDTSGSWDDVIGSLYEELELSNPRTGQFFTPKSICDLMAKMTDSGLKEGTVNDPSSGSSRNLVAHSRLNINNRYNFTYIAQDLDVRCCLMSVINMVIFGMKGYVIHCDTIQMKAYKGWRIFLPETGFGVVPLTEYQCMQILTDQSEIKEEEKIEFTNQQLSLF